MRVSFYKKPPQYRPVLPRSLRSNVTPHYDCLLDASTDARIDMILFSSRQLIILHYSPHVLAVSRSGRFIE